MKSNSEKEVCISPDSAIEEVCSNTNEIISLWNMALNNKKMLNNKRKKLYSDMNLKSLEYIMKKEPNEYAHTIFKIILEAHDRGGAEEKVNEQGQQMESYIVSSIVFVCLAGIEGNVHLQSLLNGRSMEKAKIKKHDYERFDELAKYDETKSLSYLYKIFEELSRQNRENFDSTTPYLNEMFNET